MTQPPVPTAKPPLETRDIVDRLERQQVQFELQSPQSRVKLSSDELVDRLGRRPFDGGLWLVTPDEEVALHGLEQLTDAAAILGAVEPEASSQPTLTRALRNLRAEGWQMSHRILGQFPTTCGPLQAYQVVTDPERRKLRGSGDLIKLTSPQGQEISTYDDHHIEAVDYLFNSQDSAVLADPKLGKTLKELLQDGFGVGVMTPEDPWHLYAEVVAGGSFFSLTWENQIVVQEYVRSAQQAEALGEVARQGRRALAAGLGAIVP